MSNFSEILHDARKEKGLSQRQLSERLHMPQSHVSKIERGQVDLRMSSLQEMARSLDMELMLIPRKNLIAVKSIIAGDDLSERMWQLDEDMDDD